MPPTAGMWVWGDDFGGWNSMLQQDRYGERLEPLVLGGGSRRCVGPAFANLDCCEVGRANGWNSVGI